MDHFSAPIRWLPGYLHRVRSDSLVRNSLYLMAATVVTAGLGYVFGQSQLTFLQARKSASAAR